MVRRRVLTPVLLLFLHFFLAATAVPLARLGFVQASSLAATYAVQSPSAAAQTVLSDTVWASVQQEVEL